MKFISASLTHIYRAISSCTAMPNILESSVWNLLHVTLLAPVFWDGSKVLGEIFPPLVYTESGRGTNGETGSSLHYLCDTALDLSVDEGIIPYGRLGTVMHGYEGHYLCHIMVHRHCVVSEDVLDRSATVREYLTYPLLQAAGRSCHIARFLPCDSNPDIDPQLRFFLRKRVRGHWISQVSLFDVHLTSKWMWAA